MIATHETGYGASGAAINPSATLALVANRNEGTVSVFNIAGKTLTPAGKITWAMQSRVRAPSPSTLTARWRW